jgi:hypothetical protein
MHHWTLSYRRPLRELIMLAPVFHDIGTLVHIEFSPNIPSSPPGRTKLYGTDWALDLGQ